MPRTGMKAGLHCTWRDLPVLLQHPLSWTLVRLPMFCAAAGDLVHDGPVPTGGSPSRELVLWPSWTRQASTPQRARLLRRSESNCQAYLRGFGNGHHNLALRILGLRPPDPIQIVKAGIE